MKLFYTLLFLLCAYTGWSQPYSMFRRTDTSYFINVPGVLKAVYFDSAIVDGADTILYPYAGIDEDAPGHFAHWLGKSIRKKDDGFYQIYTIMGDTVFINSLADSGDQWDFFTDSSSRHYRAICTKQDTMTVLGVVDSVKHFVVKAFRGDIADSSSTANNLEIIIGKNSGLVKTFDLLSFPYHYPNGDTLYSHALFHLLSFNSIRYDSEYTYHELMQFYKVEFHVPTETEMFAFQPGDVFESYFPWPNYHYGAGQNIFYDSILSVTPLDSGRIAYSIFYSRLYTVYHPDPGEDTSSHPLPWIRTQTESSGVGAYSVSNKPAFSMPYFPESSSDQELVYLYRPSDSSHCYRSKYYHKEWVIDFEGYERYADYKQGMYLLDSSSKHEFTWDICSLIYWIKNGNRCGEFQQYTGVAQVAPTAFTLAPNPAEDKIVITGIPSGVPYRVIDVSGRTFISGTTTSGANRLNTAELLPGMYFFVTPNQSNRFMKQ